MEKKKFIPLEFISNKLAKRTYLSPRQQSVLDRQGWCNEHTKVRIRLCELFYAPKEILQTFKSIERRTNKNNSLSSDDFYLRTETTKALNKFIYNNFGRKAMNFAISME